MEPFARRHRLRGATSQRENAARSGSTTWRATLASRALSTKATTDLPGQPDGRDLIFLPSRSELLRDSYRTRRRPGEEQPWLRTASYLPIVSRRRPPDLFERTDVEGKTISRLRLDGEGEATPLAMSTPSGALRQISPDGRWLAYVSESTARWRGLRRAVPRHGRRNQVFGRRRRGAALAARRPRALLPLRGRIVEVDLRCRRASAAGSAVPRFQRGSPSRDRLASYGVAPDGRFLLSRSRKRERDRDRRRARLDGDSVDRKRQREATVIGIQARPVRDHRQARRGRDGRGLPRDRHQARARGGDQGAAGGVHRRRGAPRALRARGAAPRPAPSSEHRLDLRPRGVGRRARAGHGARRRADARRAARGGAAPAGGSAVDRAADRARRSRRRTRRGSSTATSSRRTSRLRSTAR